MKRCFLHVCGGDPTVNVLVGSLIKFSPRMWRWSWCFYLNQELQRVFSTYVEVIPCKGIGWRIEESFLHVCGGDPYVCLLKISAITFSPRMWRWSWVKINLIWRNWVFSTYVEVILFLSSSKNQRAGFLHVCGGDPDNDLVAEAKN